MRPTAILFCTAVLALLAAAPAQATWHHCGAHETVTGTWLKATQIQYLGATDCARAKSMISRWFQEPRAVSWTCTPAASQDFPRFTHCDNVHRTASVIFLLGIVHGY